MEETEHSQNADNGGGNANKNAKQSTGNPRPPAGTASDVKDKDTEDPQNSANRRRDSRFWDFSFSTMTQFFAAIVLAGVGYLQYTVYREQASIMGGQLTMLEGQLDQMRMQQRAFITASDYKVARDGENMEHNACWRFEPIISNSGETPTKNMRYRKEIIIVWLPTPGEQGSAIGMVLAPTDPEDQFRKFIGWPGVVLGPKQNLSDTGIGNSICLGHDDIGSMWAHVRIYARGVIHYNDVFSDSPDHVTKYCFWIQAGENTGIYEPRPVICSHWNCADDECERDKETYTAEVTEAFKKSGQSLAPPLEFSR